MDFNTAVNMSNPASWVILAATGLLGVGVGCLLAKLGCCSSGSGKRASNGGTAASSGCVEIYVGNISYEMSEASLRTEFERFGAVQSARIISNKASNKSKGYGFVEMPNRPEAMAAIKALHNKEMFDRRMRVNEAKNKSHE